jgi:hypothetical protein
MGTTRLDEDIEIERQYYKVMMQRMECGGTSDNCNNYRKQQWVRGRDGKSVADTIR